MKTKNTKTETRISPSKGRLPYTKVTLWLFHSEEQRVRIPEVRFQIRYCESFEMHPDTGACIGIRGRFHGRKNGSIRKFGFDPAKAGDDRSTISYRMVLCRDAKRRFFFLAVDPQLETWETAITGHLKRLCGWSVRRRDKIGSSLLELETTRPAGLPWWPDAAGVRDLLEAAIGMKIQ